MRQTVSSTSHHISRCGGHKRRVDEHTGQILPLHIPVDEFGNPLEEVPEGEQFGGFIGGPADNPAEFGGYAQRPVFQRPTMTRPTMQERPQGQFMQHRPQPQAPRGGFMQHPENMEEQARRFAQRMMGARHGMPTQQPRRAMVSPNYRRNF